MFENITKNHILKAFELFDKSATKEFPDSQYYDVLFNQKRYPPKPIMALAEELATGKKLLTTDFQGGESRPSFKLLEKLGFKIVHKDRSLGDSEVTYAPQIHEFLKQAESKNLKTKDYIQSYKDLKVKVSFGQGAVARIPWISFLGSDQTTSQGIYPVYLYYKSEGWLILAYGISETNKPPISWGKNGKKTIYEYFKQKGTKPDRYGESYIFKVYDTKKLPSDQELNSDLDHIINEYKSLIEVSSSLVLSNDQIDFDYLKLVESQFEAGLLYLNEMNIRFISSLLTKPLVILTGLSGSGKTKLAQSFVEWISQDSSQYCIVPVGADWTNREPLLGFPNALNSKEYVKPDNGVLDLIIRATRNSELPFFLILDEMNLSHVERYFADFLSVMESGDYISLHSNDKESDNGVPNKVAIPHNVFIIGTVNIDETTYMFSPKVLDRANTIEFRIDENELGNFLNSNRPIDMNALKGKGANMAVDFLSYSKNKKPEIDQDLNKILVEFFKELKKAGAEFGFRTANEIQVLIGQLGAIEKSLNNDQKLDIAIMQKLLPKLHGSRRKLEPILLTLGKMCLINEKKEEDFKKQYFSNATQDFENDPEIKYRLSLEKICRMHRSAIDHGFASYAEA